MLDGSRATFVPILLPGDGPTLAGGERHEGLLLSAVYGANPRLADLCSLARQGSRTLLVDPKTAHFQFEGYMAMPDYRELRYGSGRTTLGTTFKPGDFATREARRRLIDEVFATQRRLGADVLLAPYFYVRHAEHPWLAVAHDCAAEAAAVRGSEPVGAVLCVDIDGILDARQRAAIAEGFATGAAELYLLVVVNYDERAADPRDVGAVVGLLDALLATGRPVVLGYVGRTGLLAVAHGAAGYASGTHGLEAHPRQIFREMMGSAPANSYYLRDWMVRLPVRLAEAVLHAGVEGEHVPCDCSACAGSARVSRMVSRRLIAHAIHQHREEVGTLSARSGRRERLAALRQRLDEALRRCRAAAATLGNGQPTLQRGAFHYLEVLRQLAGGPPAEIPGSDEPPI